jgi:hypothetical protein
MLKVRKCSDSGVVVLIDPSFSNLIDRDRVEVVEPFSTSPDGGDEIGRFKNREVLADRLTGHFQASGELKETLPVTSVQAVQQVTSTRIGQSLEDVTRDRLHVER